MTNKTRELVAILSIGAMALLAVGSEHQYWSALIVCAYYAFWFFGGSQWDHKE